MLRGFIGTRHEGGLERKGSAQNGISCGPPSRRSAAAPARAEARGGAGGEEA